jgi:lipopolysaccharide transport system ATP-binding protein
MGSITVTNLGKAYKKYPNRRARLLDWLLPMEKPSYELHWVLKDINFVVNPGEAVGIIGMNGAGKSTLLKMITGTTQPTCGSVHIQGRMAALLELGMGFHPDFTGRQNAFMAGQLLGLTSEEITALMPEIEAFAEIGEYIDQPVRVYSSGMQVRLAFAVATAKRPDILIVDEALSVGDAYFQSKCFERINAFKKDGTTLLIVSHAVGEIVKHCSRALLIKEGRILLDSSAREVTNKYLDELFGKNQHSNKEKNDQLPQNDIPTSRLSSVEDSFHLRPYYRKEEYRWGGGGAKILDYLVVSNLEEFPSCIESNSHTDFYFTVRFDSDFDQVVPGFLLKTLEGIFLYGTNSFLSTKGQLICAKKDEIKVFKFSLPMSLNQGFYLVSFGISKGDPLQTLEPLDRRYDSLLIHVTKNVPFWGIVDMKAVFEERTLHLS